LPALITIKSNRTQEQQHGAASAQAGAVLLLRISSAQKTVAQLISEVEARLQ